MSSRVSVLIVPVCLLVLALSATVIYRTSTGWHAHERPSPPPPILQLDPNTAGWEELSCLPQIGPSVARRIVEYRKQKQADGIARPFVSEDDLDEVPGIGPRTLDEIRPHLVYH